MPTARLQHRQYAQLSGFYFFFFASLGAFLPYWGLYLRELEFSPQAIGELMAIIMVTKIIGPNLWGWVADHHGKRIHIIRLTALLAALAYAALLWVVDYWWMMLILAVYSFFWNTTLPLFEATTMNHLGAGIQHYSKIRLWGSIGFIVTAMGLAPLFDLYGVQLLPSIVLALLICMWADTLFVHDKKAVHQVQAPLRLLPTVKQPVVLALLLSCLLAQASHGPYYTFFSIYLEDHGYSRTLIGTLWTLGVVAEIMVFLFMHRMLPRYGARRLLLSALLITVLRWLIIASQPQYLPVLLVAQLMHAASFGILHASAIHMIHGYFPGRLQGRGQALYSSLSFGLGGAIGSLLSGYVWTELGPSWIYYMAAIMAGLGFMVAWWGVGQARG
ncbi:MAG: MFS transporter [Gammaproteobacteria bacterium]|nr:MFS transporter [Gammaproteobacteria bacterium]